MVNHRKKEPFEKMRKSLAFRHEDWGDGDTYDSALIIVGISGDRQEDGQMRYFLDMEDDETGEIFLHYESSAVEEAKQKVEEILASIKQYSASTRKMKKSDDKEYDRRIILEAMEDALKQIRVGKKNAVCDVMNRDDGSYWCQINSCVELDDGGLSEITNRLSNYGFHTTDTEHIFAADMHVYNIMVYDYMSNKSIYKMQKSNEFHFSRDDFGWKVKIGGKTHKYPHASVDFLENMYGNGWTAGEAKANWERLGYVTYGEEYEILSMMAENNPDAQLTFGDYD